MRRASRPQLNPPILGSGSHTRCGESWSGARLSVRLREDTRMGGDEESCRRGGWGDVCVERECDRLGSATASSPRSEMARDGTSGSRTSGSRTGSVRRSPMPTPTVCEVVEAPAGAELDDASGTSSSTLTLCARSGGGLWRRRFRNAEASRCGSISSRRGFSSSTSMRAY